MELTCGDTAPFNLGAMKVYWNICSQIMFIGFHEFLNFENKVEPGQNLELDLVLEHIQDILNFLTHSLIL